MSKAAAKSKSYEQEFQSLEKILHLLEGGELTLEDSLKAFEEGVKTLRSCREILALAEQRVEELAPQKEEPQGEQGGRREGQEG